MNVGVIGQGFVGTAIYEGLKQYHNLLTFDIDEQKCNSTLPTVIRDCDIIFQCLPTPLIVTGKP